MFLGTQPPLSAAYGCDASPTLVASAMSWTSWSCRVPEFGDVVEYPLRDVERQELQDGRIAGVGLVVGRNMDRGDAAKLPEDQLDLCEIEPLRQEETGSTR